MSNNILYVTLTHFHVFIVGDDFRSESVIADDGLVLDAGEDDAALAAGGPRAGAAAGAGAGGRDGDGGARARRATRRAPRARRARARAVCDRNISHRTPLHPMLNDIACVGCTTNTTVARARKNMSLGKNLKYCR